MPILSLFDLVYALYNKSLIMGAFLSFCFLARTAAGVWVLVKSSYRPNEFNYICMTTKVFHQEPAVAGFVSVAMILQVIVFGLTLIKTWQLKEAWLSAPTISWVVNRDALVVFFAVTGVLVSVIVGTYKTGLASLFIFPDVEQSYIFRDFQSRRSTHQKEYSPPSIPLGKLGQQSRLRHTLSLSYIAES
ncbi:hypothetical protein V5O48_003987 [Marasmius crinis-equi]|uniref:Uncharacterized protein n=1 Tax=Marasmius crinis-equi TaxID=585013 RepID=A0ABR3FRE1_9AGAR